MLLTRQSGLKPTLWLDFISSQSLDSRVTASGGTNGTRVNSSGIIVAATTPRFDYDPVTLAAKGLLIEEARTNLTLQSADSTQAAWSKGNGTASATAGTAPDGTGALNSFIENTTASAFHQLSQSFTKAASALTYTYSVYIKNKGREVEIAFSDNVGSNGVVMRFNPANGTVTVAAGAFGTFTAGSGTLTAVGGGVYRATVTATTDTGTTLKTQINLNTGATNVYTGDGVSGVYHWGHQLEQAAFATSYIPTTAATVTRAGDSLILAGAGFTSIYNATTSTFYSEVDHITPTSNVTGSSWVVMEASDSSLNNALTTFINNTTAAQSLNSFAAVVNQGRLDSGAGPVAAGVVTKAACAFASGDRAISANGLAPTTGAGTHPTGLTQFSFGSDSGVTSFINGHVRRLRYYPTRLANSTLQVLTQ